MNALQKRTAQAIVNVFETGSVRGKYGLVTLISGDSGHLTYGRSQTTLTSGGMYRLIADYCKAGGAEYAEELREYLDRLKERDTGLDNSVALRTLLEAAGDDPVMHAVQDAFFDKRYWEPALRAAKKAGIKTALGIAVVYDSHVHGSWGMIRNRVNRDRKLSAVGEREWIERYVAKRREWLASHRRADLRPTVYRMYAFDKIIDADNWHLDLPFRVRGKMISANTLGSAPKNAHSEPRSAISGSGGPSVVYSANVQEESYGLQDWLISLGYKDIGGPDGQPDMRCARKTALALYDKLGVWLIGTPEKVRAERPAGA